MWLQGGVAMGSAELRQQVQEALVSATGFISDPELLTLAVTVCLVPAAYCILPCSAAVLVMSKLL